MNQRLNRFEQRKSEHERIYNEEACPISKYLATIQFSVQSLKLTNITNTNKF